MAFSTSASISGRIIFLALRVLQMFQATAVFAGFHSWLGWPTWICAILAAALIFVLKPGLITAALGVAGAHYGLSFSWVISILIFAAPALLILGLGAVGAVISRLTAGRRS